MRAMILAAGRGERMRPLTDTTPKPLLRVGGKPLIVWHIERLVTAGIQDIIINHAWLGEKIESELGDGSTFNARLTYSAETTALETAGGIARALSFFNNEPFLVINGDVWCDWNPVQAVAVSQALARHHAQAWLLLVDNPAHNPEGDFLLPCSENDPTYALTSPHALIPISCHAVQLRTSQIKTDQTMSLTFSGIGIYDPRLFRQVQPDQAAPLAPLLRKAISENHVIGSHHHGKWMDVGTPERLKSLNRDLSRHDQSRYTPF